MKKNVLLLFVTATMLLSSVPCFASDTQSVQTQQYQYTKQELQEGREKAQKLWFILDLQYIKLGNNCLKVGAEKWTERGQVRFIETTGIKNVEFETVVPEANHAYIVPIIHNSYVATINEDNSISIKNQCIAGYTNKNMYEDIHFEQKLYLKNDSMMIPLKEMLDIENQNRELSEKAVYTLQPEQCTIKCNENEIIFYKDKRDVIVNGVHLVLYEVPDMTENDVFISAQDLKMILEDNIVFFRFNKGRKIISWSIDMIPSKNKGIAIHHILPEKISVTIDKNDNGTVSFSDVVAMKNDVSGYIKNNQVMIAVKNIDYFNFNKIKFDTLWNSQNNTLTLKTWYSIAKDVVFTKDSNKMLVNSVEIEMDEAAEIKEDRFYIPMTALFKILEIPQENIIEQDNTITVTY